MSRQPEERGASSLSPYDQIGGEAAVRALVRRFYQLMDDLPDVEGIRRMHGKELRGSEEKLFLFLSGWLGGPNLYVERFGPPFLRARHLPFSIGKSERDQWLKCMRQALDETVPATPLRQKLSASISALADHMRNRPEAPETPLAGAADKRL